MIKVYLIYRISDKSLYALTSDKVIYKKFSNTRDMRKFYVKKLSVNDYQFKSILALNNEKMLFDNILSDGVKDYFIVTSYKENLLLEKECERLYDMIVEKESELLKIPFGFEMRENMMELVVLRKMKHGYEGKFNSFNIFMSLFDDTFTFHNTTNQSLIK